MASHLMTEKGDVVLVLSPAEASGLAVLAGEGAARLLNDKEAAKDNIGGHARQEATRRALEALQACAVTIKPWRPGGTA